MDNNTDKVIISKDEIKNTIAKWGITFFNDIEDKLGKELPSDVYKKALLYCLGYIDYDVDLTLILENLDILDEVKELDVDNNLNIKN